MNGADADQTGKHGGCSGRGGCGTFDEGLRNPEMTALLTSLAKSLN